LHLILFWQYKSVSRGKHGRHPNGRQATVQVETLGVLRLASYNEPMIQSFKCKDTLTLYQGECLSRWRSIESVAVRKLTQLDVAQTLEFLRSPPGNRLEKLTGDRAGQWSIRINDQWRVCFVWTDQGPADVEIVDYH
jgi:proteic killer suppression protein